MSDFSEGPESARWQPEPDWLSVTSLEPGSVITYVDASSRSGFLSRRISVLVLSHAESRMFPGEVLPNVEVDVRDENDNQIYDERGLLLGVSLDGHGDDRSLIVRKVPPSRSAYRPLSIDNEKGILVTLGSVDG